MHPHLRLSVGRATERMAGPGINCPRMLSPSQRAQIKAEIVKLEKEREICNEAGIRKVIEGWIEEQKKKLAEEMSEDS